MSKLLYGKPVADKLYSQVDEFVAGSGEYKPVLAAIGGNGGQWTQYVGSLAKSAAAHGVEFLHEEVAEYNVADYADTLKKLLDSGADGVLVEQPLPKEMKPFVETVPVGADIDCVTDGQVAKLYRGEDGMRPATAQAVIEMLDYYDIDVAGKHVVVVGRGNAVGKPLALMLLQRNATVTVCHSKTQRLADVCRNADVVVSATGKPGLVTADFVTADSIVIDVGLSFVDGKTCGDVAEEVYDKCAAVSPVPGGVGPVTRAVLLENLCKTIGFNKNTEKAK